MVKFFSKAQQNSFETQMEFFNKEKNMADIQLPKFDFDELKKKQEKILTMEEALVKAKLELQGAEDFLTCVTILEKLDIAINHCLKTVEKEPVQTMEILLNNLQYHEMIIKSELERIKCQTKQIGKEQQKKLKT